MRRRNVPVRSALLAAVASLLAEVSGVGPALLGDGLPVAPARVAVAWVALLPLVYAARLVWLWVRPVPTPTPHGNTSATPPDEPKWQGHIERFGVYWTAIYGRRGIDHPIEGSAGGGHRRSDDAGAGVGRERSDDAGAGRGSSGDREGSPHRPDYAHVVGPFCAACGTKLDQSLARRLLVLSRPVWRCPNCDETFERPDEAAFHEAATVRELCEAALEPVYYGGADRSTVDDRPDFFTAAWDE